MKEFDEEMKEVFGVSEVEYDNVNFVVGEKFSSYEQDGNNIQLVYTDYWTLDAAIEKEHPEGRESK